MNFPLPFCKVVCSLYGLNLQPFKTEHIVHSSDNEVSNNSLF